MELKESLLCVFALKGSRENGGSEGGGQGNDSGPDGRVWCKKLENRGGAQHDQGGVKSRGWVRGGVWGCSHALPWCMKDATAAWGNLHYFYLFFKIYFSYIKCIPGICGSR